MWRVLPSPATARRWRRGVTTGQRGSATRPAASGQLKGTLPGPLGWVYGLVLSSDGHALATGSYRYDSGTRVYVYAVLLWDLASGRLKATLTDAGLPLFSPDSKTLATAGFNP